MNDVPRPPEDGEEPDSPGDPIARLIKLSGPRPPVPEERMARVRDIVHVRWSEAVKRDRFRGLVFVIAAQVAAAAVLAVFVGGGLRLRDRMRGGGLPVAAVVRTDGEVRLSDGSAVQAGSSLPAGTDLTTGPGGRAALSLNSGATVRLDAGTDLRLISAFVLELRCGALYVETGTGHPEDTTPKTAGIEIRTRLGRVRDVGTQFEVRLADDRLHVSVREGVAALTRDDRTYTASAGTRLQVGLSGDVESGTVTPRGADWDWVLAIAPPFDLEGRTLREYLDWLTRETGWSVAFAEPSIALSAPTVILHGTTSGLRPDETLAAVLPACGLRHRLEGGTLVLEQVPGEGGPE